MPSSSGLIASLGQVRLTLDITPQSTPTGGDILAVAILTIERNPMPIEGQAVTFYLCADEVASETTGHDGRAAHALYDLPFGVHAVSVQIAGVHVTQRHTFTRPTQGFKRLAPPIVRAEGDEGNYLVSVSLTHEDGSPAADVPVRFLVSELGKPARPLVDGDTVKLTNSNGFADYQLQFYGDECDVIVQGPGFEKKSENLYGRSRMPKPRPYERPPDAELSLGGIMDVIRRAIQRGHEDRKG